MQQAIFTVFENLMDIPDYECYFRLYYIISRLSFVEDDNKIIHRRIKVGATNVGRTNFYLNICYISDICFDLVIK